MSMFHIMHCVPNPRMHGLIGYKEVIETVYWGLEQLGHTVTYEVNNYSTSIDVTNIVFGAQVLPVSIQKQIPENTIVYNFEQIRGAEDYIFEEMLFYANNFRIWDYSPANLQAWGHVNPRFPVQIVPVGYAPILSRIPKVENQDIDVLIYGMTGENRLRVFHSLSKHGLRVLFVSGMYGAARDNLISRSKIVLNINLYQAQNIFEVVRVSYLLANKKAVVADKDVNTYIEPSLVDAIKFSPVANIVNECLYLLEDTNTRNQLEESGYLAFQQRDIKQILQNALKE